MADTGPNRAYPSLPAVTGDPRSHTAVLRALREAIEIGERRTNNKLDSFVRLRELVELELLKIVGTSIQVGDAVGSSDGSSGTDVDAVLTTDGDLLTKIAGVLARLAAGSSGQVLTITAGAPSWEDPASGGVTDHGALTGLGDDDHTQYVLRSILTTNGDLFTRLAGAIDRIGIGSDGQVLTVSGGSPVWASPPTSGVGTTVVLTPVYDERDDGLEFTPYTLNYA